MTTAGPATRPLDPEPPHWRPLMTESTTLAALRLADLPALNQPLEGGIFAGITTTKEGQHCAVVLLPEAPDKRLPWKDAMKWAEGRGATLPARPVAAMLFANLKASFEPEWHWTCEQLDRSYAWYQTFVYGYQNYYHKSYEGRARAVRLIQLAA